MTSTKSDSRRWNRRDVLALAASVGASPLTALAENRRMMTKPIPSSDGETLPVIGLGTYDVFDVAGSRDAIEARTDIVNTLTGAGGSLIDTSPMYQRSESVIGEVIEHRGHHDDLFIATKVWTDGKEAGLAQMQRSAELMNVDVIDLMQVHNLRDTEAHMASIREFKEAGRIRYSGLTHYRADALAALETEMKFFKPDFIQINYSLGEREADERLLPLARDLGIAVIANRPYQGGALFRAISGKTLPDWAEPYADSWGQFFLKFIISHPAVTCAIPATSKPRHMRDNLEAGFGLMPEPAIRQRMIDFIRDV